MEVLRQGLARAPPDLVDAWEFEHTGPGPRALSLPEQAVSPNTSFELRVIDRRSGRAVFVSTPLRLSVATSQSAPSWSPAGALMRVGDVLVGVSALPVLAVVLLVRVLTTVRSSRNRLPIVVGLGVFALFLLAVYPYLNQRWQDVLAGYDRSTNYRLRTV